MDYISKFRRWNDPVGIYLFVSRDPARWELNCYYCSDDAQLTVQCPQSRLQTWAEFHKLRWRQCSCVQCSGCNWDWPGHLELADCRDEVVSRSEIIARPTEMARLLGWRAEGILSNVIRDGGLFISHESPAWVTIMRVAGGTGGPPGYIQTACYASTHRMTGSNHIWTWEVFPNCIPAIILIYEQPANLRQVWRLMTPIISVSIRAKRAANWGPLIVKLSQR